MAVDHNKQQQALQDRVVHIARVAKVVKGGRRFSFSALVCVGDGDHKTGFGVGKAQEVPDAIRKASEQAKKSMISVPLVEGTIPFEVIGKSGASRVLMYPAPKGKGIIAGSAARMIFDLCGIKNIVCKIHGSRNHHNVVRATINGLSQLMSIEDYSALRGLAPEQVLQKRKTKNRKTDSSIVGAPKSADPKPEDHQPDQTQTPDTSKAKVDNVDKKDKLQEEKKEAAAQAKKESQASEVKAEAQVKPETLEKASKKEDLGADTDETDKEAVVEKPTENHLPSQMDHESPAATEEQDKNPEEQVTDKKAE